MSLSQPAHILVVDDNPDMRRLLQRMAQSIGYPVVVAADGEAALASAAQNPPLAVLLDVSMPGMDGLEVCRRLRAGAKTSTVPILLVTASADLQTRLEAFEAGADDFLPKPFEPRELAVRLRSHLELAETRRELAQFQGVLATIRLISHEFNNPLQSVVGGLDLLRMAQEDEGCPVDEAEALGMITDGAGRLQELACRLMTVTTPSFKESPIGEMLDIDQAGEW